jgi:single-strand DNA-binding protein
MKLSTNEVTLIGFIGGDAQAKETKNHNKYAIVSLATTESWKDNNGDWQKRSTWHRLVFIWNRTTFQACFSF